MFAPAASDIFALILEGVIWWFPELRVDHFVAWRVRGVPTAPTFNEWTAAMAYVTQPPQPYNYSKRGPDKIHTLAEMACYTHGRNIGDSFSH